MVSDNDACHCCYKKFLYVRLSQKNRGVRLTLVMEFICWDLKRPDAAVRPSEYRGMKTMNKTKLLILYMKLPARIQQSRLLQQLITPIAEQRKKELQHQVMKYRWQAVQLQSELDEIRSHYSNDAASNS